MDTETLLIDAGLSRYEATAYIALIKKGSSDATELSKNSEIPLGRIYDILSNLKAKGFVEVQQSRPKIYSPEIPEVALRKLYLKKKEGFESELEDFKSNMSDIEQKLFSMQSFGDNHIFISYFNDEDRIKAAKTLYKDAKKEICLVFPVSYEDGVHEQFKNTYDIWFRHYFHLAKNGIKLRVITSSIFSFSGELEKYRNQLYESIDDEILKDQIYHLWNIRYLDTEEYFFLIDDYMVLQDIEDKSDSSRVIGILKIYNREYNRKLKTKFEELWENAEYYG